MLTLLSECHFWTTREEIRIKPTDYGAFKYSTKKDLDVKDLTIRGKKEYAEKRNGLIILNNKKPGRLKENVKKLEDFLRAHKIVYSKWKDNSLFQILFANGVLVHICINIFTGDIFNMAFDKYFVGKLAADVITDAVFTSQHIILAYNTNQVTIVYLQKPNMRPYGPEKISNMDPKIFHVLIPGPSERKLPRHLVINSSFDLFVIWTKSSQNEVYPWRPTIRDQDRANVQVYKIRSAKLESIGYCWTENDPICVEFVKSSEGQVITVEQKVSRKGEITAEICTYEVEQAKMKRIATTSIPIGTQICCHSFSPDQEKLVLGTIDRFVCLYDLNRKITKFAPKTDIIPTHCTWHPDSALIMITNDRSQFQCLDIALAFVANQLTSEDVTPSNLLDLSHYFSLQPSLLDISFSCKPNINNYSENRAQTDCFLLLIFENGPIGCLRFFSGTGITGDIHNSGLTPDVLVSKYLAINQLEKAVNILLALNWETYGAMCLLSLHKIANYTFTRSESKRSRNEILSKALKSFTPDLNEETKEEFGDQVIDLKRRFFFFLLRNKLYSESFEAARDVDDYDLFMDLFNVTKTDPQWHDLSREAYSQAEIILSQNECSENGTSCGADDSASTCSQSSCSECVDAPKCHDIAGKLKAVEIAPSTSQTLTVKRFQRTRSRRSGHFKNYIPPLPSFISPVYSAENIKINIPKPELKNDHLGHGFRPIKSRNPPLPDIRNRPDVAMYTENYYGRHSDYPGNATNFNIKSAYPIEGSSFHTMNSPNPIYDQQLSSWSQIPDQTLGIPVPSHSNIPGPQTLLPRPSTSSGYPPTSHIYNPPAPTALNEFPAGPSNIDYFCNIPKFYQHPLVSGNIPSSSLTSGEDLTFRLRKPATSILSNSSSNMGNTGSGSTSHILTQNAHSKKDSGEKNKVKFSDTVQVAVVPEIPRKEKPLPTKRNGFRPPLMTDPKKELADSLPLCHPHDDYLKDFNPVTEPNTVKGEPEELPTESSSNKNPPSIKVVHFGVV